MLSDQCQPNVLAVDLDQTLAPLPPVQVDRRQELSWLQKELEDPLHHLDRRLCAAEALKQFLEDPL